MTLRDVLGVDLPIIQAPMAGVQGAALAAAVSNAGGLGSLPAGMLDAAALRAELTHLRALTSRPYNVNFFCHAMPAPDPARDAAWRAALTPYYDELGVDSTPAPSGGARLPFDAAAAEVVATMKPAVVSFHFGLPAPDLLARVKQTGAKVLASATTVDEAIWLERQGADVIVAQGIEAGGHRGSFLSDDLTAQPRLLELLRAIVGQVRVPVVAAGGIADTAAIAVAIDLGAVGVQVGTAYLLCPEASTSAVHRAALTSRAARATAITNVFTGRPARGIVNRLMKEMGPISPLAPPYPLAAAALAPLRAHAESRGSGDFSPLWAGENAGACREVSAGRLTRQLAEPWDDRE